MTRTRLLGLLTLGTILILGLGLLFGAARNSRVDIMSVSAPDTEELPAELSTAPAPVEPPAEAAPSRDELELSEREQAVAQLEAELSRRMRELDERIESVEVREETAVDEQLPVEQPPERPKPVYHPRPGPRPVIEPEPEPDPISRIVTVSLPTSTPLSVELTDGLSSETSLVGDPVQARVFQDVIRDGLVVIPAGSAVLGQVTEVVQQKQIGGQSALEVRFDSLRLSSGEQVAIQAVLAQEGRRQKRTDAATIGGSAAGGAILGRVLSKNDKGKGTVIGAVLGAAIGTAVASRNQPVEIAPGTVTELLLESPIQVAVREETSALSVATN